jgi:hypothetical protein
MALLRAHTAVMKEDGVDTGRCGLSYNGEEMITVDADEEEAAEGMMTAGMGTERDHTLSNSTTAKGNMR